MHFLPKNKGVESLLSDAAEKKLAHPVSQKILFSPNP